MHCNSFQMKENKCISLGNLGSFETQKFKPVLQTLNFWPSPKIVSKSIWQRKTGLHKARGAWRFSKHKKYSYEFCKISVANYIYFEATCVWYPGPQFCWENSGLLSWMNQQEMPQVNPLLEDRGFLKLCLRIRQSFLVPVETEWAWVVAAEAARCSPKSVSISSSWTQSQTLFPSLLMPGFGCVTELYPTEGKRKWHILPPRLVHENFPHSLIHVHFPPWGWGPMEFPWKHLLKMTDTPFT